MIESDIRSRRLAAGTIIGTKPELASAYGVGPEVFRQAARLLEQRGIAQMRRGKLGGLVVATPKIDSVAHALATFFEFANISFSEFLEVDNALHAVTFGPSAHALTVDSADDMRRRLRTGLDPDVGTWRGVFLSFDIRQELVDRIKNPALSLLHQAVMLFFIDMVPFEAIGRSEMAPALKFHLRNTLDFVEALIANDVEGAIHLSQENRNFFASQKSVWQRAEERGSISNLWKTEFGATAEKWTGRRTLADKVARQFLRDIRLRGWKEGACLGTEGELLQVYSVSRATFRQAVRLLEHYSAAKMQRGPKGGLVVTSPDPDKLVSATASYLRRAGITLDHVRPLQTELQVAAIGVLCQKPPSGTLQDLRAFYAGLETSRGAELRQKLAEFQQLLTVRANNRVLEVFLAILSAFASPAQIPLTVPDKRILTALRPSAMALLQSLADSDRARGRRAMLDYLAAETPLLNA